MNLAIVDDPVWRTKTDPLADQAVVAILAEGGPALLNTSLELLSNEPPHGGWPKALRDYVAAVAPPLAADQQRITQAQDAFMSFGVLGVTILACASLPETYCLPGIAKLLAMSGQLTHHVGRRLEMTGQMLFDVMTPGGLEPGGVAFKAVLRTRLMHGGLRYMLLNEERIAAHAGDMALAHGVEVWTGEFGQPINQLELVYTLMTFSHVVLRSAVALGIEPQPGKFEDYIYAWNVVGRLLGIEPVLLPDSRAEAEQLFERIKAAHATPTEQGAHLMRKLEEYWIHNWPFVLRPLAGPAMGLICDRVLTPETRQLLAFTSGRSLSPREVDLLLLPAEAGLRLAQHVFTALPSTAHLAASVVQHWANRRTDIRDGGFNDTHQRMLDAWFDHERRG